VPRSACLPRVSWVWRQKPNKQHESILKYSHFKWTL
jgi:hypothetical protein